ncbi:MAG: alpha/beta fold hydrolase [Gemmataceae bacterium]
MTLAHEEVGTGRPVVVLLHAFPLSRAMWQPQRAALADCCRLLTPDLPGFGDSALLSSTPSVDSMADAVAGWLDHLGMAEPVILGGLSMGGYISLAFARRHGARLAGLILADTKAEPDDDTAKANRDKMIGFASTNPAGAVIEQMLPKLVAAGAAPLVREQVRRIGSAQRPGGIIAALQALRNRPDATPTLATIRVPTLIVVGQEDALTPPAQAEAMARAIPNARQVVIPGAGHLANLEAPEAFNTALRSFVQPR